ncbi:MAG: hypothetical protein ACXWK6_04830 [Myxococcaceae bacterium]
MLLGTTEGLAERLRAAADALEPGREVEAGWLRGAAALVQHDDQARHSARASAVWLEELGAEARARKFSLLRGWLETAGALRAALHLHDTERGPLTQALFPEWREPALRRHVDQALAFEVELQRRLSSGYVVRRLAEPATERVLRPALDALEAAQASWSAERDRPALSSPEADEVRSHLLAIAVETARTLERVRAVVRAALPDRPELIEGIFPRRARPAGASAEIGAADAQRSPAGDGVEAEPDLPRRGDPAAGEPARPTPDARTGEALENRSEAPRPRSRKPVETTPDVPRPRSRKPGENPAEVPRPRSGKPVTKTAGPRPPRAHRPVEKRDDAPQRRSGKQVEHAPPEIPASRTRKPRGTPPRSGSRRIAGRDGERPAAVVAGAADTSMAGPGRGKRARPATPGQRPRRSSPPARRS